MAATPSQRARRIVVALTSLRLALGPAMLLLNLAGAGAPWLVGALVAGFLSDVFDGVVARRGGVSTAGLRRFDSRTDTAFYLCVIVVAWLRAPSAFLASRWLVGAALALELGRLLFDRWKFGLAASYHAYSAKAWGLLLFIALALLLGGATHYGAVVLRLGLIVGIVSHLEGLAMSLLLTRWEHDVAGVWRVPALRRAARDASDAPNDSSTRSAFD